MTWAGPCYFDFVPLWGILVVFVYVMRRLECPRRIGDTNEYIDYRIRQAGAKTMPFTSDALTTLHEATGGQLRDIDRVATKALRAASRRKLAKVDAELLAGILEADQRAEARG